MKTSLIILTGALVCAATTGAAAQAAPKVLGVPVAAPADSAAAAPAAAPSSAVARALADYRASGRAATIPPERPGDFLTYPFGHVRPVLRCATLRNCQIDLQPGEVLADDLLPADPVRWDVDHTMQGQTTVVLVRAKECDVSTNLIIITDRRRYVVDLEVPPCRGTNPRQDYMEGIRFWYPDEPGGGVGAVAAVPVAVDAAAVNAGYRWGERRGLFGVRLFGRRYLWTPVQVVDDGRRTIIRFSPAARSGPMPSLYAVPEDGTRELVNTTVHPDPVNGDAITADRVARRWVLVLREGKREHKVEITQTGR
ncbi:TrbG/VirB9 family P-type conjugative transfer protein [Longimicrobium sp.]|uniref:TrbG/VirB9 family P-type conjugative transfer protein n=1 Tax=Longimicrobium sp. TaxID=2029185 RepID=UPI002E34EDB7|nr:TrbG/VirB9 family P-type conjugative transfer protein [Longimicrobium sp.]HEX6036681.1 TrbG/VirB9 family P-type conjugative transfer protein [Longimicrobium sp.]